jgi:hypothetical protein
LRENEPEVGFDSSSGPIARFGLVTRHSFACCSGSVLRRRLEVSSWIETRNRSDSLRHPRAEPPVVKNGTTEFDFFQTPRSNPIQRGNEMRVLRFFLTPSPSGGAHGRGVTSWNYDLARGSARKDSAIQNILGTSDAWVKATSDPVQAKPSCNAS